jgi:hypothetical protein
MSRIDKTLFFASEPTQMCGVKYTWIKEPGRSYPPV